ncbi:MAG: alpha/beta hydrolase [Bacteroidales bacterium]|nr:alpha/beta hydrolase [Bacteroidales bacterium]
MKTKLIIAGPNGNLSALLEVPEGLEKGPLVILMHGFMSNKKLEPLKSVSAALLKEGVATLRFDFDGHGQSEGRFRDMTVLTELEDALAVYQEAVKLPFVTDIALLGHSQGGVVASLTAAKLGCPAVKALVMLSAAAVLKDDALNGVLMGKHYDPANPPEKLHVLFHTVGRNYFTVAQHLPLYEDAAAYKGPVCLVHGTQDKIVPFSYSEKYHGIYPGSELHLLENENHILSKRRQEVVELSVRFLIDKLKP